MKQKIKAYFKRLEGYDSTRRLITLFVCLILIPTCVLFYIYYLKSSSIIEQEVSQSILQTLGQIKINIENKLDNVEGISESVFVNKDVMAFVGDENSNDAALQSIQMQAIRTFFSNEVGRDSSIRIRLFVDGKKMASTEKVDFFSLDDLSGRSWFAEADALKGGAYWTGVYTENYIDTGSVNVVSCARVVKHSYNYNNSDGMLLVDVRESSLYAILSNVSLRRGEQIYLVDSQGRAVSCRDKNLLGKTAVEKPVVDAVSEKSSGIRILGPAGRETAVIYQTIGNTGWKLVDEVDRVSLVHSNLILNNIFLFVILVAMFIFMAFSIFLNVVYILNRLHKRLKVLAGKIECEGVGTVDESVRQASSGDYVKLETYVYGMIRKVKDLMEESYQSELREREARLTALQAQINPHFLYNTLDTINWMAIKIHADDISGMISSLAKYFRLSLSKGKSLVSIRDEIELVRIYLTLQQTRYQGAIRFEIDVDPEVEPFGIVKLTLQPIVENAILHGIQKTESRRGIVRIRAERQGEKEICISISDDGVGMDADTLQTVLTATPCRDTSHYGLYNVNERIRLRYGPEYGLRILSEPGKGTTVEVHIEARPLD